MAAHKQNRMLEPGNRAPDFQLQDAQGQTWRLRDLIAKGPVVAAFFKITCPVCQLTFPFLDRMHRGPHGAGMQIFGISQDDPDSTREFTDEFGVTFPILFDTAESGYPAANAFNIAHVPSVFLIEPDGMISWTMEGFDKKALEALGSRAGVVTFTERDRVPAFKAG
jgi:peroxiredoxin